MLDHVSITVTDFAKAERFYDAALKALGIDKVGSDRSDGWIGYGERCDSDHPDRIYMSVRTGLTPKHAPGRHWCFKAARRMQVDAIWHTGLASGGADGGRPGLRTAYHPSYYAAFLLDPDGNRIEAVCHRT